MSYHFSEHIESTDTPPGFLDVMSPYLSCLDSVDYVGILPLVLGIPILRPENPRPIGKWSPSLRS